MSERLTAEPGSLEYLVELCEVARQSTHPMDKVATRVLEQKIAEAEAEEVADEP